MEFHFKAFLKRIRMTQYGIAEKLGCNQSLVATWNKGKFPTYEKICKLIEHGITAQELFGKELAEKLMANSGTAPNPPHDFNSPEFKKGVLWVLEEYNKQKQQSDPGGT